MIAIQDLALVVVKKTVVAKKLRLRKKSKKGHHPLRVAVVHLPQVLIKRRKRKVRAVKKLHLQRNVNRPKRRRKRVINLVHLGVLLQAAPAVLLLPVRHQVQVKKRWIESRKPKMYSVLAVKLTMKMVTANSSLEVKKHKKFKKERLKKHVGACVDKNWKKLMPMSMKMRFG